MRYVINIMVLWAGILTSASAQDFTDRLQQKKAGQGTVTVHQAADISQLVNKAQLAANAAAAKTPAATTHTVTSATPATSTPAAKPSATAKPSAAATPSSTATPEEETLPVDNSKKMLRNGVKVNGYRVQAYAGGNSRKDRQQAEAVGNAIKSNYPDVPVYVHFYSPRWICRVGNFRTYEEAHQMLQSVRKLGYTQATIVKGKITVQY